jgi:uncharacterized integral membrane protein
MDERGTTFGDDRQGGPKRSLASQIRLWGSVGAGGLLVVFLLQNLQTVNVHFLWMTFDIKMVFALLIAAALGALTTVSVGFLRGRARAARERRELAAMKQKK